MVRDKVDKSWLKIWLKIDVKIIKKMSFISAKKLGLKIDQNRPQNDLLKNVKNGGQKLIFRGGSGGVKNCPKSTSGTPGGKIRIFWNFRTFCKSSPLFDPQFRPPTRARLKTSFPTNRLCFCSLGGVKNVTFWGFGGRTARSENRRHDYRAKIDFWALLDPQILNIYNTNL
jgi:hypothetical protein